MSSSAWKIPLLAWENPLLPWKLPSNSNNVDPISVCALCSTSFWAPTHDLNKNVGEFQHYCKAEMHNEWPILIPIQNGRALSLSLHGFLAVVLG